MRLHIPVVTDTESAPNRTVNPVKPNGESGINRTIFHGLAESAFGSTGIKQKKLLALDN